MSMGEQARQVVMVMVMVMVMVNLQHITALIKHVLQSFGFPQFGEFKNISTNPVQYFTAIILFQLPIYKWTQILAVHALQFVG